MRHRFNVTFVMINRPLPELLRDPFLVTSGGLGLTEATSNCGGEGGAGWAKPTTDRHAIRPSALRSVCIPIPPPFRRLVLRRYLLGLIHDHPVHRTLLLFQLQSESLDRLENRRRGRCIRRRTMFASAPAASHHRTPHHRPTLHPNQFFH